MRFIVLLLILTLTSFGSFTADGSFASSHVGDTYTVDVNAANLPAVAVGGQFFLHYNPSLLRFVSADPVAPFSLQIYEAVNTQAGDIDYACGIPSGGSGTQSNSTFVRLTFTRTKAACVGDLVQWRTTGPNGALNMLSSDNAEAIELVTGKAVECE